MPRLDREIPVHVRVRNGPAHVSGAQTPEAGLAIDAAPPSVIEAVLEAVGPVMAIETTPVTALVIEATVPEASPRRSVPRDPGVAMGIVPALSSIASGMAIETTAAVATDRPVDAAPDRSDVLLVEAPHLLGDRWSVMLDLDDAGASPARLGEPGLQESDRAGRLRPRQ